jgi:hypothetical protein
VSQKSFSLCDGRFDSVVNVVPIQDALLAFQPAQRSYQFRAASRLSAFQRVAQPLGSLEGGRPGTTLTTLSNRGLTYEQPFCDRLHGMVSSILAHNPGPESLSR